MVKVEGWLYQQDASDTTKSSEKDKSLQLLRTWSLDHTNRTPGKIARPNQFSVSESGAIGISCDESPSLSVIYPDTDEAPVILSNEMTYCSATFVKFRGKEHLAAECVVDGCLHLWDIKSKTFRNFFDPKIPIEKQYKHMNICNIDESTIGYGEVFPSLDESRRVFILKTDTAEHFTLCGTVKLFTPGNIWGMCHIEMEDGTPCLLFCIQYDNRVMSVKMVGGKTRWEVGKEQMGERFDPYKICTDDDNTVYVADFGSGKIHLLSPSDGTVIKRFDVGGFYGIKKIVAVRFYNQHLYVEHAATNGNVYTIVQFKRIKEM